MLDADGGGMVNSQATATPRLPRSGRSRGVRLQEVSATYRYPTGLTGVDRGRCLRRIGYARAAGHNQRAPKLPVWPSDDARAIVGCKIHSYRLLRQMALTCADIA